MSSCKGRRIAPRAFRHGVQMNSSAGALLGTGNFTRSGLQHFGWSDRPHRLHMRRFLNTVKGLLQTKQTSSSVGSDGDCDGVNSLFWFIVLFLFFLNVLEIYFFNDNGV